MPLITSSLNLAIKDLKQGKPVAIPTETVYGLAAMIDKESAIKAVFLMKHRPLDHPLIVHIAQYFDLSQLVEEIPDYAKSLMAHFWPGPLTLVFCSKKDRINPLITGGQSTVAIRCPAHPLAQKLLIALKTPLVAPSANPFGKVSPTTALHVKQSFAGKTLTILDGGRCGIGIESTIVDATNHECYQILRHGLIDKQALAAVISSDYLDKEHSMRISGSLNSHYQPQKTLYYFDKYETLNRFCQKSLGAVYVMASQQPNSVLDNLFHKLAEHPKQVAFELYYQLRAADESKALCIAIELPPAADAWQGVRERILKAGSPPYSV